MLVGDLDQVRDQRCGDVGAAQLAQHPLDPIRWLALGVAVQGFAFAAQLADPRDQLVELGAQARLGFEKPFALEQQLIDVDVTLRRAGLFELSRPAAQVARLKVQ